MFSFYLSRNVQADERAVLKHFSWPERKADALREAAFEYRDLNRLLVEISSFQDNLSLSFEATLKKITALLDKWAKKKKKLIFNLSPFFPLHELELHNILSYNLKYLAFHFRWLCCRSERSIQRLIKLRDTTMVSFRDCKIPVDWMLDSGGMICKVYQLLS